MSEIAATYRRPPPGLSQILWREFQERGIVVVENAYDEQQVARYRKALLRVQNSEGARADGFFTTQNFVEKDSAFADLIDHPSHAGLVYDLYGEMLKLQLSELFVRTPGGDRPERWHIDGPRVVPYSVFAPEVPLQVKVGVWLTDVTNPNMGNLVYLPGSHRCHYFDAYDTSEPVEGEEQLLVRSGSLTLMNCALWLRTAPNNSSITRMNLYLGYCPSWIPTTDRTVSDPKWLAGLNREQRIIMRSYEKAYSHAKPPVEDFPLFLDRETGMDRESGRYRDLVRLFHRKRTVAWERFEQKGGNQTDISGRLGVERENSNETLSAGAIDGNGNIP
jgi:ectoine hydroxylase-related dioxygenase (phytanoyl-CoA dioxygenase family)